MLIITILSILGIMLGILALLVIASWFLTHSILATILIPVCVILLYKIVTTLLAKQHLKQLYAELGMEAPILEDDRIQFRDLNKNGRLDVYEDPRQPIEDRVEDLLGQMTVEEKVGLMFSPML